MARQRLHVVRGAGVKVNWKTAFSGLFLLVLGYSYGFASHKYDSIVLTVVIGPSIGFIFYVVVEYISKNPLYYYEHERKK